MLDWRIHTVQVFVAADKTDNFRIFRFFAERIETWLSTGHWPTIQTHPRQHHHDPIQTWQGSDYFRTTPSEEK